MTPSEDAKKATAALHQVLHISPGDFDANGTTAVIEQAIRNATVQGELRILSEGFDPIRADASGQDRSAAGGIWRGDRAGGMMGRRPLSRLSGI